MARRLVVDVVTNASCPEMFQWDGHTFLLGEHLASGRFASVRALQTVSPHPGLPTLVGKVVDRRGWSDEADLLNAVSPHPHIVRLFGEVRPNLEWRVLILERAHGELFTRVETMEGLDESAAARWMAELMSAVEHCHSMGIAHRDIKPENLLLRTEGCDAALCLADFGAAKRMATRMGFHSPCGSKGYAAPEASLGRSGAACYGAAADLWSCGVVAYVLLTGTMPALQTAPPLNGGLTSPTCELIAPAELWYDVSTEAVDLVRALLQPHGSRLSASEARLHPWLNRSPSSTDGMMNRGMMTPDVPAIPKTRPGMVEVQGVGDGPTYGDARAGNTFPSTACRLLASPRRLRDLRSVPDRFAEGWECSQREWADRLARLADDKRAPVVPHTPPPPAADFMLPRAALTPARTSGRLRGAAWAQSHQQQSPSWGQDCIHGTALVGGLVGGRALSVATGLDRLASIGSTSSGKLATSTPEQQPCKRMLGMDHHAHTPSSMGMGVGSPVVLDDASASSSESRAAWQPGLKRARSISSHLMRLCIPPDP